MVDELKSFEASLEKKDVADINNNDLLAKFKIEEAARRKVAIKEAFYAERAVAFKAFEKEKETAFNILAKDWQAREDLL